MREIENSTVNRSVRPYEWDRYDDDEDEEEELWIDDDEIDEL